MQYIIGIPPHIIMAGIPMDIIAFIAAQHSFMRSMLMPSIGIILHVMPSAVISQFVRHIIGIGMGIIIGIIPGIIELIMLGVIMPPIPMGIGIMPGIIGIIEPIMFGIIAGIMFIGDIICGIADMFFFQRSV